MDSQGISIRALLLVGLVAFAGTAAASIVVQDDPNPIAGVEGELSASENLTVVDQRLDYAGTNVTAVNLTVNNTASSDVTGTIHLEISDSDGTTVASKTVDRTFTASAEDTVTVDLAAEPAVENVTTVEATIEE